MTVARDDVARDVGRSRRLPVRDTRHPLRSCRHRDVQISAVCRCFPPDDSRHRQSGGGRQLREIVRGNRIRHPLASLPPIIFNEYHPAVRLHMLHEAREHAGLMFDEVEDVREQHPIDEVGELERAGDVGDDPIDLRRASQRGERLGVAVDGVDVPLGTKPLEQRSREGPIAGTDVRPGAAFLADGAGDEVDCVARVQATAAVAGTFVRPRYARNSMMPLMITWGYLAGRYP